ncbi:hypothetical protein [Haloarcula pelagica]|uniref:hypothetical protein n=1 Tax=Haloarcula pelagica TaxID=3033389 RepID=UPI0024C2B710|nr:hypothetical protein [Halomicroarcula sp. YJ-61-S]
MTRREIHVASAVPVAFLAVIIGHHPLFAVPLVAGTVLPELDALREHVHRSWALHTFLLPAVMFAGLESVSLLSPLAATAIHFVTLGMALHFVTDYVYPREMTHVGARWPVRPVVVSAPWGLLWLGVSWTVQWFLYLSSDFIPWLVGFSP